MMRSKEVTVTDRRGKLMKRTGAWNIVFGVASIAVGVSIGTGCLITGAKLLSKSR